ncbi:hypothetical protein CBI38_34075 (plasmid) [Rhodococcus oxybenzonivorans]|uniref:Uncharacterized protein n=1 Tax=Rhodococcus oxybenzonivorans TaxID=1990687 RepID=A0A2S2C6E3_9NOCA|nr:hypothetical protein [Rhodococcus oxybenzonivorans]AWK76435.1 hypothetical protein CBI38_34075 [Rhodococcus oxybenzonivorans]
MTEPVSTITNEIDVTEVVNPFTAPDPYLQSIADFANRVDAGFGLTLYLPWGTARGTVVSAKSFFARIAEEFSDQPENHEMKPIADVFAKMMEGFAEEVSFPKDDAENGNDDIFTPRFITLQNVQVQGLGNRGPFPSVGFVPHLRVKLSDVTAWSLEAPTFD